MMLGDEGDEGNEAMSGALGRGGEETTKDVP
jgi:hypothetical protein